MTDAAKKPKSVFITIGPNLFLLLILGSLIGYIFKSGRIPVVANTLLEAVCWGIIGAYIMIQWAGLFFQSLSFMRDPIPLKLEIGNRDAVYEHTLLLKGRNLLAARARHLLESWARGGSPEQVITLAGFQSTGIRNQKITDTIFILLLIGVAEWTGGNTVTNVMAAVFFMITLYANQQLLNRIDSYIEARLLARLTNVLPGTTVTTAELASALGESIQNAFKYYVPHPEDMASAIRNAEQDISKSITDNLKTVHKSFIEKQGELIKTLSTTAGATNLDLKNTEKALSSIATELNKKLSTNTKDLQKVLTEHTTQMEKMLASASEDFKDGSIAGSSQLQKMLTEQSTLMATTTDKFSGILSEHTENLAKTFDDAGTKLKDSTMAGGAYLKTALGEHEQLLSNQGDSWKEQLQTALKEHSSMVSAANKELAEQLNAITKIAASIDEVLQVQKTIEGTMQQVKTSSEFEALLSTLNKHLETSDELLKQAAKPKRIRLVETPHAISES